MRKLLSTLSLSAVTVVALAVPAKRGVWKTVHLADGTEIKVELRGDEYGHFWQAENGVRYVRDASSNVYKAADMEEITRKAAVKRRTMAAARFKKAKKKMRTAANAPAYTGSKKGLLILAQFSDKQFKSSNNLELYRQVVNGENYSNAALGFRGSVRDYFRDQSDGQFDFDIDVAGPVTLQNKYSYYGANDSYGQDAHAEDMIKEACGLVDNDVDFTRYDWDGDGEADQVFVVYAGHGEASYDDENTVWPHAWYLKDGAGIDLTLDGVRINSYACGSELGASEKIDGIGTICHEFSHCFGLPDMYDTAYSGNFGMCTWSLMDEGSDNGNGFTPAGYTSYEKMAVGWKMPVEMTENMEVKDLKPYSEGGDAYILYNDGNRNEYFLLENRQLTGWDSGLDDSGLLAIHVDYDAEVWEMNEVNTTTEAYSGNNHQRCTIIPADGIYNTETYQGQKYGYVLNDAFPYKTANSITGTTKYATLYNKSEDGTYNMNKSVLDITQNADGTVSFRLEKAETGGGTNPSGYIFYESFDLCNGTGGNDGLWSGNIASSTFNPDNVGWSADTSYGADKCARFGTGKKIGNATTPAFTIDGEATLTFMAAPWGTDATTLNLSVNGNATIAPAVFTMNAGQWTTFTATIRGNGSVNVTFKPGKRVFLDEIKAYTPATGIKGVESVGGKSADYRIYHLDGRYAGTDINSLPCGIYIVGGRKIVK